MVAKKTKRHKKLRIAHVHWAFPPIIGGVETHLVMLLPELVKRGHEASLLTGSAEGASVHETYKGVKITRAPIMNLNWLSKRGLVGIESEVRNVVGSFLDRARPHVVHAHNMNYFSKTHAKVLDEEVKKRKIPLVLTAHNSWDDMLFLRLTRKIRWDHIIAVSFYIKKELMGIGCDSNQVTTIHHGIDINRFKPTNRKAYSGRLAFLKNKEVIFHPARMGIAKGCDISVKAMRLVIKKFPNAVLVLAGTKNIVDWTATQQKDIAYIVDLIDESGIKNNVFIEMFTLDEMVKLYAISEVCLYPSTVGEPFGLTMLESLASGKPMIVTNSGGMPEIIQDGINGYVVPIKDYEAIANKIITLLDDGGLRERIGSTGRKFAELRFTKGVMAENNIKIYKQVTGIK
ncbi:MAG: glycosyltransferase family 4 protein [Candidatus Omnitrophota bacterium]|nr:MAG: glycosyltransferase family 4 protein [Candidatus Omnitrophota bacterium]